MILAIRGRRTSFRIFLFQKHLLSVFLIFQWAMLHLLTAATEGGVNDGCKVSWNVSVVLISWRPPAVRVRWHLNPTNFSVARFELTYRPLNARYRVVYDIPREQRSLILERLQPGTEYQLHIVAFDLSENPTNISGKVHFVSPDVTQNDNWNQKAHMEAKSSTPFTFREEEVVIIVLVLAVWVFVIVLFFNKWGKIRMLEPYQPQYHSHPVIAKPTRLPLNDALAPLERFNMEFGTASTPYYINRMRSRQNSVFVGSPYRSRSGSMLSEPRMPRKVKSAEDIKSLVIQVGDRNFQQPTAL
ncbi:uncharacterized protein [Parasteatoda tepidariorum]|uniref:uncharacterized protein n=1 Tax=Parasteatoda tepidariorum TaxID=114398 RepID=UPI00077FC1FA|nr:uncharacterized protein LOC107457052 [Parasteatoda tepidariorum]